MGSDASGARPQSVEPRLGSTRLVRLGMIALVPVLLTVGFGGWLVGTVTGDLVHAHIEHCYRYYSGTETMHHRCEGYWRPVLADTANAAVPGPVVGVPVDPHAPLADPNTMTTFGYEVSIQRRSVLATRVGDAAVVIPTSQLVLGPIGAAGMVGCLVAWLIGARRRLRAAP